MWLFTGIVTGLFIAFLYYLSHIKVPLSDQSASSRAETGKTTGGQHRPGFDFYNLLPDRTTTQPQSTASKTEQKPKPPHGPQTFIIQAGSFPDPSDADRLKAKLTLLGFDVKVHKVSIPSHGIWYRVQLGPFPPGKPLEDAKSQLSSNQVDYLVIENKR